VLGDAAKLAIAAAAEDDDPAFAALFGDGTGSGEGLNAGRCREVIAVVTELEGPAYDLPIAVGIFLVTEQVADLPSAVLVGELSLDGQVRGVTGVLPLAASAQEHGLTTLYLPQANAAEEALVDGLEVIPVASQASLVGHLHG
jgi:hypothetical protein